MAVPPTLALPYNLLPASQVLDDVCVAIKMSVVRKCTVRGKQRIRLFFFPVNLYPTSLNIHLTVKASPQQAKTVLICIHLH